MAEDTGGTRAVMRLLSVGVGVLMLVVAYRYVHSGSRDPVAAARLVALRFPQLREDKEVDRLGPACDGGDLGACVELGLNYGGVRETGAPVPPCIDHELYARACDGGEWRGCQEVARTSRRGDCGEADLAHAREVLSAACEHLVFAACDAGAEL
jgi:hypothetical protein